MRDKIDWGDEAALRPTTLAAMREAHHDLLADYRCAGKDVVMLNITCESLSRIVLSLHVQHACTSVSDSSH